MAKRGLGNVKPKGGNNDSLRLEEVIEIHKFTDYPDTWVQVRLLDKDILPVKRHWVKIIAGKTKKTVTIPRFCISFNPEDEDSPREGIECPYCAVSTEGGQDAPMRNEYFYLMNGIVRELQEDEPARKSEPTKAERKSGNKDIKSKTWTPVRVIRLTNGMVARLQELGETNIVKNKKKGTKQAYDVSHPKFGVDVNIKYKPKSAGSDKYSIDKSEDGRTPLTEEEESYLTWGLTEELLDMCGRMTPAQAKEDFKRMDVIDSESIEDGDDEDEDDDDSIDLSSSKKGKSKKSDKKKKSKSLDDDEDEDDDDEDDSDSDDDDDDEPPAKKKSKKDKSKKSDKKKKKKPDLDDDEDDEDDEPPVKKKSKKDKSKKSDKKKKKKSSIDDWDDDDE